MADVSAMTADALSAVEEIFDDYVVFPDEETRDAVTLWVAHAHVFYAFESTPRLSIFSTDPGSGKSRVLEVIEHLVPNPLNAVYMTPGVMWRAIEHTAPTILLDEVDTIFGKNGSSSAHRYLRGILNAGHKRSGVVPRCVGSDDVKNFKVFAPVAMAGLGTIPDTIKTRSIPVAMRKRKAGEQVRPFRLKFAQDALQRARMLLEDWAQDAVPVLKWSVPELPVKDRDADVWEPVCAVADLAGDDWPKRARKACETLTAANKGKDDSPGVKLLSALREIFGEAPVMFTRDILAALYDHPSGEWTPEAFDARALAHVLAEYGVSRSTIRQGEDVGKGFKADDLAEPWSRYVK